MKNLILIREISGAGKSSLANILSENEKYPVLSADMYFEDYDGNWNFDPTKLNEAHGWCQRQVGNMMSEDWKNSFTHQSIISPEGYTSFHSDNSKIFVANTFTQEWEMEPYFELAERYGYIVTTIIVENRHGNKSIHNVPDEKVQAMKDHFKIKL